MRHWQSVALACPLFQENELPRQVLQVKELWCAMACMQCMDIDARPYISLTLTSDDLPVLTRL